MYRHSVHVQPQQDSSSNSPAAWDAGRNQGLTSDTASSDQFGSGRGSGGPTAGEQVQGGAQRIKESAQDFANPNSGLPEHSVVLLMVLGPLPGADWQNLLEPACSWYASAFCLGQLLPPACS